MHFPYGVSLSLYVDLINRFLCIIFAVVVVCNKQACCCLCWHFQKLCNTWSRSRERARADVRAIARKLLQAPPSFAKRARAPIECQNEWERLQIYVETLSVHRAPYRWLHTQVDMKSRLMSLCSAFFFLFFAMTLHLACFFMLFFFFWIMHTILCFM